MTKQWFVMEEIENSHPCLSVDAKMECVDVYKYGLPKGTVHETVVKGEGYTDQLCFIRSEFVLTGQVIFKKILQDVDWALALSEQIIRKSDALFDLSKKIFNTDPKGLSDNELAEQISQWVALRKELHGLGMPWNYVEFENYLLSSYLTNYITEQVKEKKLSLIPAEVFATLSKPHELSFAQREEIELLQLALDSKGGSLNESECRGRLAEHSARYCWLPYLYLGPAWNQEHFAKRLQESVDNYPVVELKDKLDKLNQRPDLLQREQEKLIQQIGFDFLHRKYVQLAQSFIFTKAYRKDAIYHGFYSLEHFFKEAARRLALSLQQFRMLMSWELASVIRSGEADGEELNRRWQYRVFHYDGKTKTILSGAAARSFFANLPFEPVAVAAGGDLSGVCACPGQATGKVKVINIAEEMEKMAAGDVLVSRATTPDIVAAMKKAAAIVTDMGGITCHAAIVSRELGIPCVIGTKIATRVLKDGDLVEVDATRGVVKKI